MLRQVVRLLAEICRWRQADLDGARKIGRIETVEGLAFHAEGFCRGAEPRHGRVRLDDICASDGGHTAEQFGQTQRVVSVEVIRQIRDDVNVLAYECAPAGHCSGGQSGPTCNQCEQTEGSACGDDEPSVGLHLTSHVVGDPDCLHLGPLVAGGRTFSSLASTSSVVTLAWASGTGDGVRAGTSPMAGAPAMRP